VTVLFNVPFLPFFLYDLRIAVTNGLLATSPRIVVTRKIQEKAL
jgi:hypothetical protein